MDVSKKIAWSDQLEEYFAETGEKCQGYAWLHKKSEAIFASRRTAIDIPVIVLSTIAGTLSIGSNSIFGEENETQAGMGIGLLSLSVGVLNTISTYFGYAKRTEGHRLCNIEYSKLFRFISIELSLPREERMLCGDLLKVVKEQYERLQEIAPLIPQSVIDEFKKKFKKYENVAKPSEANGLEAVQIYRDGIKQTFYDIVKKTKSEYDMKQKHDAYLSEMSSASTESPKNLRISIPDTHTPKDSVAIVVKDKVQEIENKV